MTTNNSNKTDVLMSSSYYGSELTDDDIFAIRLEIQLIAGLSLLSLIFVQFIFWFFKSLRSFAFELVMWLCISSIFHNLTFFFHSNSEDTIVNYYNNNITVTCSVQALLSIFFSLSSMIWSTLIGYTAYKSVNDYEKLQKNKNIYRFIYILLAFTPAALFTLS